MKSKLLAAASAAVLFATAGSALAADLPEYAAPAEIAVGPSFTWSGFYVGANAGYVWGDHEIRTRGKDPLTVANVNNRLRPPKRDIDGDGFTVGGQIGYNHQFDNSPVVIGIEADLNYTDIDDTSRYAVPPLAGPGTIRSSFKQELEYLGTVRGRLGYAFDRFMVYGTGGLAYGKVKTEATFRNNDLGGGAPVGFRDKSSKVEYGYAVGGGVEYAVTDNITIKGEYLYFDLGDTKLNVNRTAAAPAGQTGYRSKFENDGHIVRAGVNYKF